MKLTVIGTGYVGLVSGACLAEMGNSVTCVDIDAEKLVRLERGEIPIYEPGLERIVQANRVSGRLRFVSSLSDPAADSDLYFVAVGTPPGEDGSADLSHVLAVARDIGSRLHRYAVIVNKSTVPVGTAERTRREIRSVLDARGAKIDFDVVSNPEFLKEGDAVEDFMKPDRVIVGTDSERARAMMRELYAPFMRSHERLMFMGIPEAEMTKYAANCMLATRISFMNEIAGVCDALGVDVESVRQGLGSDPRIGWSFLYPGAGYGGSCFPKDVKALIHTATGAGLTPTVLQAVEDRNADQKRVLERKIRAHFGESLKGLVVSIWGLAFKPGTDDMREAPSLVLIRALIDAGATVRAHDPVAMPNARLALPEAWFASGQLSFVDDQYAATDGADALVLVTEWKPFRRPDFADLRVRMRGHVIFDGRNQYDPARVVQEGFDYHGIGRRAASGIRPRLAKAGGA